STATARRCWWPAPVRTASSAPPWCSSASAAAWRGCTPSPPTTRRAAKAWARPCSTPPSNSRAAAAAAPCLYERLGYRRLAALESYYEDGGDGWRYEKLLTA